MMWNYIRAKEEKIGEAYRIFRGQEVPSLWEKVTFEPIPEEM